jgi:hypothetical protein
MGPTRASPGRFGTCSAAHASREIVATIAKESRPRTQTVAGYDLTFSPVKSESS